MVTEERTKEILKKLHETVVQFEEEEAGEVGKDCLGGRRRSLRGNHGWVG